MNLLIRRETPLFPALDARGTLTRLLSALLQHEGASTEAEISLTFCDDGFIRALNASYRGQDTSTDVLSFAQQDPALLGDIIISLETAARQAERAGWLLESEVALLATHGLLHLLGYDDETVEGAAIMRQKSLTALSEAGIELPAEGKQPYLEPPSFDET